MLATLPHGSHIAKKRGVFYYRRRLPGRVCGEVAISLRTRHFRVAEHLARALDKAFPDAWNRAVSEAADAGGNADLNAILRQYFNLLIGVDLDQRLRREAGQPLYDATDQTTIQGVRERERIAQVTGTPSAPVARTAAMLMTAHGMPAEVRRMVEVGVSEVILRAVKTIEAQMRGEQAMVFTAQENPLPVPASAAAMPSRQPKPLLSVVEESYFTHRATVGDATHQVMGQEQGTLRRFREVSGDRAIDTYGRGDVTCFLDLLRRLPIHYGKSHSDKDRTLANIIAEADQKDAVRVSDKTVKRHLSALSQFFKFCFDKGHLTHAEWKNLVGNHSFRDEGAARDQRDQWLPEELVKLFGSPVWQGSHAFFRSQPGQHIIRDWRFWLPLLALFHGARLEEFADLRISDLDSDRGTWFFKIQEGEARRLGKFDQTGRKAQERRLKNTTATRAVPLHPELVRLGFIQHVDRKARDLNDPLFPELRPQGKDRKRGPRVTRWFGEYRKAVGVYREGVAMHAFRHTANTRLRDAMTSQQEERIINYLLGHIPAGGGEGAIRYDKGPSLQASAEVLGRLKFPELDLTHLYHVSDG